MTYGWPTPLRPGFASGLGTRVAELNHVGRREAALPDFGFDRP